MDLPGTQFFEIHKRDLSRSRLVGAEDFPLEAGQVRLLIDDFALTANNVTYAAFGDAMRYWSFFPSNDEEWGRLPVWGFATVNESLCDEIDPGERFYGFFPMGSELIVEPGRIKETGFSDISQHRSGLAPIYNQYVRLSADPSYRADFENQQLLYRPLFSTSFLIDDYLAEREFFDAEQVVLSSASSKTALALAWLLKARGVNCIALTSQRSRPFVKNTQIYDDIALYDDFEDVLQNERSTVFVDFAGNMGTLRRLHTHFSDCLNASLRIGATDWRAFARDSDLTDLEGPKPEFFFAPAIAEKRVEEIGADELNRRIAEALLGFYEPASKWIKAVRVIGGEAISECYDRLQKGDVRPSEGFVMSFSV